MTYTRMKGRGDVIAESHRTYDMAADFAGMVFY
jgi:hypothetical protein